MARASGADPDGADGAAKQPVTPQSRAGSRAASSRATKARSSTKSAAAKEAPAEESAATDRSEKGSGAVAAARQSLATKTRTTGVAAAAAAAKAAEKAKRAGRLRQRVLPRSVLGISALILAFAIGAGFSGVVLYSYYQYKLNQTNDKVNSLINGYKKQFANAEGQLNASAASAKAQIQNQLKAIQQIQAGPGELAALVKQVSPSVYFVHTEDANGQPSVGTAFVVASNSGQSLLLTSYTTVAAATHSPSPPVYIRQGNTDTQVTVRTWDPQYDLALLVLPQSGLKALQAAPPQPAPSPGDNVYAVSGSGSAGASVDQGSVVDVSASFIAVDAPMGSSFQGGPIVNQAGQVIAVGSRTYAPLGFNSQGVWYVPYVEAACNKVLTCPNGTLVGAH